jgi:hypothetical protein
MACGKLIYMAEPRVRPRVIGQEPVNLREALPDLELRRCAVVRESADPIERQIHRILRRLDRVDAMILKGQDATIPTVIEIADKILARRNDVTVYTKERWQSERVRDGRPVVANDIRIVLLRRAE